SEDMCSGLRCQVHTCSGGNTTTVSGTIYDPSGNRPLSGVVAYIPGSPLGSLPNNTCYSCSDLYSGDPIAGAVSDSLGQFTIHNPPDGANIPLVIQIGKWRRTSTLPPVTICQNTPVPDNTLLLPGKGGDGDMPQIAISTGGGDSLECLLFRMGIDKG